MDELVAEKKITGFSDARNRGQEGGEGCKIVHTTFVIPITNQVPNYDTLQ